MKDSNPSNTVCDIASARACSPYVKVDTCVAFASKTLDSPKSAICITGKAAQRGGAKVIIYCQATEGGRTCQEEIWQLLPCIQSPACRMTLARSSSAGRWLLSRPLHGAPQLSHRCIKAPLCRQRVRTLLFYLPKEGFVPDCLSARAQCSPGLTGRSGSIPCSTPSE